MSRRAISGAVLALLMGSAASAETLKLPIAERAETRAVSVTVVPGITGMNQLRTEELRDIRARMHDGAEVSDGELRSLAERGDGLAAQRYVRRLLAQNGLGRAPSDVAYFAAIAVGAGRVWTLPDMVHALGRLDPATEPEDRVSKYIQVLYPHAWAGNDLALEAVVRFNGEGKLFGALSEATKSRILEQSRDTGDGRPELRLALAILQDPGVTPAQMAEARRLLERARGSDRLSVVATAENLLALTEEDQDTTE